MIAGIFCGCRRFPLDVPVMGSRPLELILSVAFMNPTVFFASELATELPKAAPRLVPTIDATGKLNAPDRGLTTSSPESDETTKIRASSALPSTEPTVAPTEAPAEDATDMTRSFILVELPLLVSLASIIPCVHVDTDH